LLLLSKYADNQHQSSFNDFGRREAVRSLVIPLLQPADLDDNPPRRTAFSSDKTSLGHAQLAADFLDGDPDLRLPQSKCNLRTSFCGGRPV